LLEKQGIITVFLDTPYEDILDHLFADTLKNYEHKKNNELIVRATLQAEIDLLSENGKTPSESEVKAIISRWAAGMLPRRSCFALADITVVPERGMNPGEISLITAKALLSFSK
jgi:hypothetical protein